MKVKKAVFVWKKVQKDPICLENMERMDIVFEEGNEKPIIFIDAGSVKIEDSSLDIDCQDVLKKLGKINFEEKCGIGDLREFTGEGWELWINDKKYEGLLNEPRYVIEFKRIIRFNAIEIYANKKLSKYLQG